MAYNKRQNDIAWNDFINSSGVDEKFIQKQMDIAAQIENYLKIKGWNQNELAEEAGLRPSQVSEILAGKANPTLRTITKLEEALEEDIIVSPDFYEEDMEAQGWGRPGLSFILRQDTFREFIFDPSEIGRYWADESIFVQGSFKLSQKQKVSIEDYPRLKTDRYTWLSNCRSNLQSNRLRLPDSQAQRSKKGFVRIDYIIRLSISSN